MPWPSFFFRSRKPRDEADSGSIQKVPAPKLKGVPSPQRTAGTPQALPITTAPSSSAPEPEAKPAPAPVSAPPSDAKNVARAMEEADPLKALSRSLDLHLSKRTTSVESPAHTGPILTRTTAKVSLSKKPEESSFIIPPAAEPREEKPASSVAAAPITTTPESAQEKASAETSSTTSASISGITIRRKASLADVARHFVPAEAKPPAEATSQSPAELTPPPVATPEVTVPASEPVPPSPATEEKSLPAEPSIPTATLSPLVETESKKEFLLTNGERIIGKVLSDQPEAVYLEHGTLGVITLPRAQIATRPVEIILINGDRIVGDIMAETHDTLYVRHASLGMLSVPRSQRSNRVIEVILKDGDRILGEVLTETEHFTVIKSASLGTVSVPHNKVALVNRKLEQLELKPVSLSLEDKPDSSKS